MPRSPGPRPVRVLSATLSSPEKRRLRSARQAPRVRRAGFDAVAASRRCMGALLAARRRDATAQEMAWRSIDASARLERSCSGLAELRSYSHF